MCPDPDVPGLALPGCSESRPWLPRSPSSDVYRRWAPPRHTAGCSCSTPASCSPTLCRCGARFFRLPMIELILPLSPGTTTNVSICGSVKTSEAASGSPCQWPIASGSPCQWPIATLMTGSDNSSRFSQNQATPRSTELPERERAWQQNDWLSNQN